MNNRTRKILGIAFQIPLIVLVIAGFIGSIYAAATGLGGVTWPVPVIFFIILALYFVGIYMRKKASNLF